MELNNCRVLITGGAVRLGRNITQALLAAGCRVCCHYHQSRDAALLLQQESINYSGQLHLLRADLTDFESLNTFAAEAWQVYNGLDVLIHNAAIFFKTPFGQVSEEDWDKFHSLNLKSSFFLSQFIGQKFVTQKSGKIIHIGDAGAKVQFPGYLPYSISKAGLTAMNRGLAKTLAPHVQVNIIQPGPVLLPEDYDEQAARRSIEHTLLKRTGQPEDISGAVIFLIGNDYMTGSEIAVDGGRSLY